MMNEVVAVNHPADIERVALDLLNARNGQKELVYELPLVDVPSDLTVVVRAIELDRKYVRLVSDVIASERLLYLATRNVVVECHKISKGDAGVKECAFRFASRLYMVLLNLSFSIMMNSSDIECETK